MQELAAEIDRDYADRRPVLVAPLKSSVVFLTDLSRALAVDHELDFLELAPYAGGNGGSVERRSIPTSTAGSDTWLVIMCRGTTLAFCRLPKIRW